MGLVKWYDSARCRHNPLKHYVIMGAMASQITSLTIVYSTVYSGGDQRKNSKLPVTGLCAGNSPVTDEFPAQMASNTENISIWWRHHELCGLAVITTLYYQIAAVGKSAPYWVDVYERNLTWIVVKQRDVCIQTCNIFLKVYKKICNCYPLTIIHCIPLTLELRHVQHLQTVCIPHLHIVQPTLITSAKDQSHRMCQTTYVYAFCYLRLSLCFLLSTGV